MTNWKKDWDVPFRYVFSGNLTPKMREYFRSMNDFQPLDILESQINKSNLRNMFKWKEEGFCRWLFCDSGAFSVHTGRWNFTVDDYIEYINEVDDKIDVFAQLDTIPGKFGKPKSEEDYENSANDSWESFLYLRSKVPNKMKIMPVFHFGEDIKYLDRMLDYVDEDGDKLDYIGLSPANDASVQDRMLYLQNMYDHIHASSNPYVKTHVYGFTSLEAMSKFPCYSADSITHRLLSGYNKIFTKNFGIISVTKRPRTSKGKSSQSFLETADKYNLDVLRQEFYEKGVDLDFARKRGFDGDDILDWIPEDNNIRVAFSMKTIQELIKTKYQYTENNLVRSKKLF